MKALGVAFTVAALLAGMLVGRSFAPPEAVLGARVVTADIAGPIPGSGVPLAPTATREVQIDLAAADMRADAAALLAQAATHWDPAAAAQLLLPAYGLAGPSDACADSVDPSCPFGLPATLVAVPAPPSTPPSPSAEDGRPPTAVFAVTADLVAVSVAHRAGERVSVLPNAVNGIEPQCDPVVTGYDLGAHPLPTVESVIDPAVIAGAGWDESFSSRTTFSFDIGEGLSMYLCAEVLAANSSAPNYRAEALVQTADRLVPTVFVVGITGLALPGWTIEGFLPGGEPCGAVRVPTVRTFTPITLPLSTPIILCDATDSTSSTPEGRGVLPFSRGDGSSITIAQSYSTRPAEYVSLDLGPSAVCTGVCVAPATSTRYAVVGTHGTAVIEVQWSQGSRNDAAITAVGPIVEPDYGDPGSEPIIVVAKPPAGRQLIVAFDYRVASGAYSVGASRTAAFLTVRAGGVVVVGPREGQCFGNQPGFDGAGMGVVLVGDTLHLSGSLQTMGLVPDVLGCVPDWSTASLAVTFAVDIPVQQLIDDPGGVTLRIEQPVGADPSVQAPATATLHLVLLR